MRFGYDGDSTSIEEAKRNSSMSKASRCAAAVFSVSLSILLSLNGVSQTPWAHPDGSTHWYQVVALDDGIDWNQANSAALAAGGHLATITSAQENAFVFSLADHPEFWILRSNGAQAGPWIGGVETPSTPGTWRWVRGEPFVYSNWAPGLPDNQNGNEDRIHFGEIEDERSPTWNDLPATQAELRSYIIEWEWAPDQTLGHFITKPGSSGDFTLFAAGGFSFLVDQNGNAVNFWATPWPGGLAPYLQDNGNLLRLMQTGTPGWAGGRAGRIEERDWNGALVWAYDYSTPDHIGHHDISRLPNGNVLLIAWEKKSAAEAIAEGRDPSLLSQGELWPLHLIEISPTLPLGGTIVWEWHLWDHLIQDFDSNANNFGNVANHPELVDINYNIGGIADWNHTNAIDYNPQLDQIVVSVRSFNEIWIIDHSTTSSEAASHSGGNSGRGGDLMYRWGNPRAYRAGGAGDQLLFGQHDAHWIKPGLAGAGNIMVFNNGLNRPAGNFTTIEEIATPVDAQGNYPLVPGGSYGPASTSFKYRAVNPSDFFSRFVSSAQRLPNGNTLVCAGAIGEIFEVTPAEEIVWKYVSPYTSNLGILNQGDTVDTCGPGLCNAMFRAYRHPASHPGFAGHSLAPLGPVEHYPDEVRARFGTVNFGLGSAADVLLANGQRGDVWRKVYVEQSQTISLTMDAPPAGPAAAAFALYVLPFENGLGDVQVQPLGLGTAAMPLPLLSGPPVAPQVTLANNFGLQVLLGAPLFTGVPLAPSTVFQALLPVGSYTIQGYVLDQGATSTGVSITNAIVLEVY